MFLPSLLPLPTESRGSSWEEGSHGCAASSDTCCVQGAHVEPAVHCSSGCSAWSRALSSWGVGPPWLQEPPSESWGVEGGDPLLCSR